MCFPLCGTILATCQFKWELILNLGGESKNFTLPSNRRETKLVKNLQRTNEQQNISMSWLILLCATWRTLGFSEIFEPPNQFETLWVFASLLAMKSWALHVANLKSPVNIKEQKSHSERMRQTCIYKLFAFSRSIRNTVTLLWTWCNTTSLVFLGNPGVNRDFHGPTTPCPPNDSPGYVVFLPNTGPPLFLARSPWIPRRKSDGNPHVLKDTTPHKGRATT